jgi:hypothetical protein
MTQDEIEKAYKKYESEQIGSMQWVKKPKKPTRARKAPAIGKTRAKPDTRTFPKWREGMSTLAYIRAYHEANSSVMLTMPEYLCN